MSSQPSARLSSKLLAWHQIPGWFSFQHVYDKAVERAENGAQFVELGVALGRSALYMAEAIDRSGKDIHFTAIDRWNEDGQTKNQPSLAPLVRKHGGFYEAFEQLRAQHPHGHLVHPLRSEIVAAAASFADNSIDFVMLDAGHTYEKTVEAIKAWVPKLKEDGVLAGDDYSAEQFPGVVKAVNELLPERAIYKRAFVWRRTSPVR